MRRVTLATTVLIAALLVFAPSARPQTGDGTDSPPDAPTPTVVPGAEIPEIIQPSAVFEAPYGFTIEQAYADPDRPAVYVLGTQEKLLIWPMLVFAWPEIVACVLLLAWVAALLRIRSLRRRRGREPGQPYCHRRTLRLSGIIIVLLATPLHVTAEDAAKVTTAPSSVTVVEGAIHPDPIPATHSVRLPHATEVNHIISAIETADREIYLTAYQEKTHLWPIFVFAWPELAATVLLIVWPFALLRVRPLRRRSRQVKDAPHCRRCAYRLTGLNGTSCPECGADVTGQGTVTGRPAPVRYAFAWVVLLAAPSLLVAMWLLDGRPYTGGRWAGHTATLGREGAASDWFNWPAVGVIDESGSIRYTRWLPDGLRRAMPDESYLYSQLFRMDAQSGRLSPVLLDSWLNFVPLVVEDRLFVWISDGRMMYVDRISGNIELIGTETAEESPSESMGVLTNSGDCLILACPVKDGDQAAWRITVCPLSGEGSRSVRISQVSERAGIPWDKASYQLKVVGEEVLFLYFDGIGPWRGLAWNPVSNAWRQTTTLDVDADARATLHGGGWSIEDARIKATYSLDVTTLYATFPDRDKVAVVHGPDNVVDVIQSPRGSIGGDAMITTDGRFLFDKSTLPLTIDIYDCQKKQWVATLTSGLPPSEWQEMALLHDERYLVCWGWFEDILVYDLGWLRNSDK